MRDVFEGAEDGEAVLRQLFAIVRERLGYAALFVVRGRTAVGRDAAGDGLSAKDVKTVTWRIEPANPRGLATALSRPADQLALVIPVRVHDRLVALLYADGDVERLDGEARELLRDTAVLAGQAIERRRGLDAAASHRSLELAAEDDGEDVALPFDLERRAAPRASLQLEISVGSESHFYSYLTDDLSAGGVFVVTYQPLSVGTDVQLEFNLPAAVVRARGRVRWSRRATEHAPPGIGIAFTELGELERKEIDRFCKQRVPLLYDV
jgi:uncharacterized protein (TIGR02266 family)